ncbi:MAG: hypothetical protein ACXWR1_01130 [Bdellovibrionota bacterium]
MKSTTLLFTVLIAAHAQAAEVPLQSAPRFVDSVIVQGPQFQGTRFNEMTTAGTYPVAEALAPGEFFVFEDNGNATLVRANGQTTTVKCDLMGNSFLWKNEVTTRSKSYWDAQNEVAVKSLRLTMTYHSDAHLRIDFKNGTCTAFEPLDGDSQVSFQNHAGKFVYYRDYGYQQSKGAQLISYDPISQTKTILADCKDLHAAGVCTDFRKFAKGLAWPTVVGVTDRNQVVLQTDKQILLLDATPGAVKVTGLFAVKDGDPTRLLWGSVLAGHKLSFLMIKDEGSDPNLYVYTPAMIALDSGAISTFAPRTVSGAALDSTGRYLLTWAELKEVHWKGTLFDSVSRIDLSTGATINLPPMGAYTYPTNPATYGGTLSFFTGDVVSYKAANQSASRQWVKFSADGTIQAWDDRGAIAASALSADHASTLGAIWNSFGQTSDLQLAKPFTEGSPTTLVKVPQYRLCEYWFSGNCWNSGDFYFWPETNGIAYYDPASKSLKTKTLSP